MPSTRSTSPSGHFSEDGQSFIVAKPDTPHPLVNIISTGDYGVAVAQTGAGCSWGRRPADPVTRGSALFTRDGGGRALYLRDDKTGRSWSVGWQPLRVPPEKYECAHGVGNTLITSRTEGVQAQWLVFVPCEEPLEVWRVRIRNFSKKTRTLSLWSGVEWSANRTSAAGAGSSVHEDGRILLSKSRPSTAGGDGGVFFHGVNLATKAHTLDRRAMWGAYGSSEAPEALAQGRYQAGGGREPFAGFCVSMTLKPGEERSVLFTVGWAEAQSEALLKARKFQDFGQVDHAWNRTQMFWDRFLSALRVKTPDTSFDLLVNIWLKYLALSQGLWGGRGPKDARVFLPLDPSRLRREILSRAGAAGNGAATSDVPWPALLLDYLRETADSRLLDEKIAGRGTLYEASRRVVKELAALPSGEEDAGVAGLLSDWADMVLWAEAEGRLPAREKEFARKLKAQAARRGGSTASKTRLAALQDSCRRGRAREAWELFQSISPLPPHAAVPPLFAPELSGDDPSPAALFRVCVERILGVRPAWNGLRIRPCLPPAWREARLRREFRGALYDIRFKRAPAKPAGFQEISLNGRKVDGDILPVAFGRKNEVLVLVGRAK